MGLAAPGITYENNIWEGFKIREISILQVAFIWHWIDLTYKTI